MSDAWFRSRFRILTRLAYLAGLGAIILAIRLALRAEAPDISLWAGIALILPAFLFAYLLPIWHWKARYVGNHSDLWGALLVVEVSGWFKIVYWFRHVIPDYSSAGRYSRHAAIAAESGSEGGGAAAVV